MNKIEDNIAILCSKDHKYFLDKSNVVGVCVGSKISKGVDTGQTCLTVMVTKKVSKDEVECNDLIPSEYNGVITDVVETGIITADALTSRIRPVLMGYSIGPSTINLAGTAGALVTDGTSRYILSNNHVLAGGNMVSVGTKILQPALYDGGRTSYDVVASLYKYIPIQFETRISSPINYVDAAIAKVINNSASQYIAYIGNLAGVTSAVVNMQVKKVGRTTSLTNGKVIGTNATVRVAYSGGKTALFKNQIITTAMSAAGDSGSLVLTQNNYAVGLLFAGSSTLTVLNPIFTVLAYLGVSLVR